MNEDERRDLDDHKVATTGEGWQRSTGDGGRMEQRIGVTINGHRCDGWVVVDDHFGDIWRETRNLGRFVWASTAKLKHALKDPKIRRRVRCLIYAEIVRRRADRQR